MAAAERCASETSRVEPTRTDAPAGDRHSARRRRTPAAQVELALVREQRAVPDVEWLLVDEQPDDLPIRHVDDRLARLG
jgi:hypothetical protein